MSEATINRLRLLSGLVLFSYVAAHLVNLSLGLASIHAMNMMLAVVLLFWGHWSVQTVLGLSLIVHLGLAMRALWRRRSLRMPPAEMVQFALGFLIPFMLALHISKTRVAESAFHAHIDYSYELYQFWVKDPGAGAEQVLLLVVAWVHACIGLNFNLRLRRWYGTAQPFLLIAAFSVPFLALIGFVRAGVVVRELAADPGWTTAVNAGTGLNPAEKADILFIAFCLRMTVLAILGTLIVARWVRRWAAQQRGTVTISYSDGKSVRIAHGTSILEASRDAGIPHASICGGRGRCSTCRVHVVCTGGTGVRPGATDYETSVLERMRLPTDVRLACQLRPEVDVAVTPLLVAADARRAVFQDTEMGAERELAILFCDLRGFTQLSEHRLPFDVVFLLNRYFAAMGQAIEMSGGRIDKFIGDGVMALFGLDGETPVAACRGALAAAARMSNRVDQLNATFAHDLPQLLRVGIGIHFGTVVVGEMGWGKASGLTAIGDCVNTASRIESLSKTYDAELVISEDVERQSGLDLSPWARHKITVRGRTTPMQVRVFDRARELASATERAVTAL
ncbi:MAG TPA: adenylate/guanylate cyclase domain-containing protein [Sphingobium sp.]|uniref:adenylate/guanylate cyclase domain-containing protein n=1 Tax=Sphingobium sp. TaxID=1912891 RepID=UPI002ED65A3D